MQKFPLGHFVATPSAIATCGRHNVNPLLLIGRHVSGDYGDLDDDDWQANVRALVDGSRILSAYVLSDNNKVWIITEADRSATCILLPDEY